MLELTDLQPNNVELSYEEEVSIKGAAKGFAGGFLGSLAKDAFNARYTGSFGYTNLGAAASLGLAVGTVGLAFGGPVGAALSE